MYRTYIDVINFVKSDKKRFNMNTDQEKEGGGVEEDQVMEGDEQAV